MPSDFVTTLRGLLEKATPGPWKTTQQSMHGYSVESKKRLGGGVFINAREQDCDVVCNLRNHAEAILRVVEAAKLGAASIDHLMAFKGSRLEETQREGHLRTLYTMREALAALDAETKHEQQPQV